MNADWRLLSAPDTYATSRASGHLLALMIAMASALALLFYRKPKTAPGAEVGVYWLGCALIALQFIPWLYDAYDWNWYSEPNVPNQLASGLLAALIIAAISAAVLVYRRGPALGALEIGCYWAGLTIGASGALGLNFRTGVAWSGREAIMLSLALSVAAAIPIGGIARRLRASGVQSSRSGGTWDRACGGSSPRSCSC